MSEQKVSGFGFRLRELREAASLSQEALAQRAGMHRFGIAKLERGEREPVWATVRALARALGVSCSAFESDSDAPTEGPPKPRGRPRKDAGQAELPPAKKKGKRKGDTK
jgi:transcriptional regulator with XRE-family HTH domain